MPISMISDYHRLIDDLVEAIRADDMKQIQKLDQKIVSTWNRIMSHQPSGVDEMKQLVSFLLDQLIASPDGGNDAQTVKRKILKLIG